MKEAIVKAFEDSARTKKAFLRDNMETLLSVIEVIAEDTDPKTPLCDGMQSIRPSVLAQIVRRSRAVAAAERALS